MIDVLDLDDKTISILEEVKATYPKTNALSILADWLEENGNVFHAEYIRLQIEEQETCWRSEELERKYKGTWLGNLWFHKDISIKHGLIWEVPNFRLINSYFKGKYPEYLDMQHWLATLDLYQINKSINHDLNLILLSLQYVPSINSILDCKIKARVLSIANLEEDFNDKTMDLLNGIKNYEVITIERFRGACPTDLDQINILPKVRLSWRIIPAHISNLNRFL